MSVRLKKYRLTCSKIGCTYHKILPLYPSNNYYLLSDNKTISTDLFSVGGWCETCNAYRQIFSPKSIEQINAEIFDIEDRYNKSGFLGFGKSRSQKDTELWELNRQILDVLRRRKDIKSRCYTCRGTNFNAWGIGTFITFKVKHPNCGGVFAIEPGEIIIGSNLVFAGTSFKGWEAETAEEYMDSLKSKGNLLDPDDKIISYL